MLEVLKNISRKKLSKEDRSYVSPISKTQAPLHCIEGFKDVLRRYFGVRHFTILYVILDQFQVPDDVVDPSQYRKVFGASVSVIGKLISYLDHDDPLYKSDHTCV